MSESDGQDRTEDASSRRLDQAREEGRLPRSRELIAFSVLFFTVLACFGFGPALMEDIKAIFIYNFDLHQDIIFQSTAMTKHLSHSLKEIFFSILPILISSVIACFAGSIAIGGWNISSEAIKFDFSKMDPLSGLKRMFSLNSLVELVKALLKFSVMIGFTVFILYKEKNELISLTSMPINTAIVQSVSIVFYSLLHLILALLLVVMVDVPFQLWNYKNELKMSKQELREEYKETEGRPEVKGKIRQAQKEMSKKRMMEKVPTADVIITNPDHFAVALQYVSSENKAPRCIAKGVDFVAGKIKEIASENEVPIIAAPPLARALFYATKLDQEIPVGLYKAVAQVLAYVYQLKEYEKGKGKRPGKLPSEFEIPTEFKR